MVRQLFVVASLSVLAAVPASAQMAPGEARVILTSGHAEVKRAPDRAWVMIQAESRARDPKEAQRLNADAMAAVTAKLKGMPLGDEAIRTVSYELQPEFDYNQGRQTLRGYVARNAIEVRVDEITRVGDVLGAAVGSGATSVGGLRFDVKDRAGAEREALTAAVRDARSRADAIARGAGLTILEVLRIDEQRTFDMPPRPMMQMREVAITADAASPTITPGTIEIRAQVTLTVSVK